MAKKNNEYFRVIEYSDKNLEDNRFDIFIVTKGPYLEKNYTYREYIDIDRCMISKDEVKCFTTEGFGDFNAEEEPSIYRLEETPINILRKTFKMIFELGN